MTHAVLSKPDRDALFTLIHFKEPATNNELDERCPGTKIYDTQRKRLEGLGLISSRKETTPRLTYLYELTDAGWEWVEEELNAETPPKADRTARVDYPLHNRFIRYCRRNGIPLSALFIDEPESAPSPPEDIDKSILTTYQAVAKLDGDWVPLLRLRTALEGHHSRSAVDTALETLFRSGQIRLIAEVNRKALTPEDRAAAVFAGGEDKHLIRVEPR